MRKEYDKTYFDEDYYKGKIKSNYGDNWTWESNKDALMGYAKEFLQFNANRVLDVGCGPGFLVRALREHGVEAYGVDVSKWATDQYEFCQLCDVTEERLPFPDNHFDLVICQDVLEHLPTDKHDFIFSELRRVCSRFLIVISPFLVTPEQVYGEAEENDPSHIALMPVYYYLLKFNEYNFKFLRMQPLPNGHPWDLILYFEVHK